MKFFLDTADLNAIMHAHTTGLIDGITTNPTHISRESGNATALVKEIAQIMYPSDVSVEVTQQEPDAVYRQAHNIAQLAPNIVVKVPCATPYLPIISKLVDDGIALNITLVFSAVQGLCMAKLAVKYISPFIGRLDDIDADGMQLVADLKKILDNYQCHTQLLAASIRSVAHIRQAALIGADIATLPVTLFNKMLTHPLTDKGMEQFNRDWQTLGIKTFP